MKFEELNIIEPILKSLKGTTVFCTYTNSGKSNSTCIIVERCFRVCSNRNGKNSSICYSHFTTFSQRRVRIIIQRRKIKSLVITPTRELALQIGESFSTYGKHTSIRNTVIFGGVKQGAQTNALRNGVDILVATPGRLLDLMDQGFIRLNHIEYFVLDEADRMLDMGFIHDIRKIIAKLPIKRQSLFFSATMPGNIVELSRKISK